jgi:hypothetical protein
MDIEFHYYMTYLIAARAGFSLSDATTIAWASQGVDDNHVPISVSKGTPQYYENTLSQTMDITRPHHDTRIYPIFHFIPGDPHALTAQRVDKRTSHWNTTPNSLLANEMIDAALASKDHYRIGASAHGYCDTWAHQNFVGIEDDFNVVPIEHGDTSITLEFLNSIAKIGHGPAKHKPDWPGLTWVDGRLAMPISRVVNRLRFIDAARHLFDKFYRFNHAQIDEVKLSQERAALAADLTADIGVADNDNVLVDQRIARYNHRALSRPYGGTTISAYQKDAWPNKALNQLEGNIFMWLHDRAIEQAGDYGDLIREGRRAECAWKNPAQYKQTDWYKFQEAIRSHLDECWEILLKNIPEARQQAS